MRSQSLLLFNDPLIVLHGLQLCHDTGRMAALGLCESVREWPEDVHFETSGRIFAVSVFVISLSHVMNVVS